MIRLLRGTFIDESEIITKVKTASPGEYQVIHSSGDEYYKRYVDGGFTSEINEANIPNMQYVMQAMIEPFRKMTPKLSCVPYDYGTTGIAYNSKVISEAEAKEKGAALLVDPKYQGKIGGYGDMVTRVWYGALASGQNPNDIKDIEAVWAKVRENRDLVKKYWSSGAELMDLLAKEEIVYARAGLMLSVLIWANVFWNLEIARNAFPTTMNWTRVYFVMVSLGCVLNIVLNYYLIPLFGGMGAVIASVISYWFAAHGSCFVYRPLFSTGLMMSKAIIYPKI